MRALRSSVEAHKGASRGKRSTERVDAAATTTSGELMRRDVLLVLTGAAASAGSAAAVELAEVNEDALPQLSNQAQLIRLKPRQEVTKVPRQSVGEEFAIALMRSSYNALESLRCRSMTSFQEDFFFSRQALLPQYNELALPLQMRIGVLEDPLYFDFISSAQYDSIVKGLRNPSDTFEETVGAEGERDVVRRDTSIPQEKLHTAFATVVGNMLCESLRDEFNSMPAPLTPDVGLEGALSAFTSLARLFEMQGYANRMQVEQTAGDSSERKLTLSMEDCATAWGTRKLIALGDAFERGLINDHFGFAAASLLREAGLRSARVVTPKRNSIVHRWKIVSK